MPFRILISPYKSQSAGANTLQHLLDGNSLDSEPQATSVRDLTSLSCKKLRTGSPFITQVNQGGWNNLSVPTIFLRWGNGPIPEVGIPGTIPRLLQLNCKYSLENFTDKRKFFATYYDELNPIIPTPIYNSLEASSYLTSLNPGIDRPALVERQILTGHSGAGIRLLRRGDIPHPDARLWTKYIPKEREFRVHFFRSMQHGNIATFIQEKLKRRMPEGAPIAPNTYQVRNWQNGWVYATGHGKPIPDVVKEVGIMAAKHFLLDFGAIDIIYNKAANTAYVLEVNTAPGITGRTANFYANTIRKMIEVHDWDARRTGFKSISTRWPEYISSLNNPTPMPPALELEDENAELEDDPFND